MGIGEQFEFENTGRIDREPSKLICEKCSSDKPENWICQCTPESTVERALHEAIGAIYFADDSDYLSALWTVVSLLGGEESVQLLENDPGAAWHKYDPATIAKAKKDKQTKEYMERVKDIDTLGW